LRKRRRRKEEQEKRKKKKDKGNVRKMGIKKGGRTEENARKNRNEG
jgi:hypothetical protein